MSKFRRGFKSQCEKRSVELRKQIGLTATSPLNAFDLANHIHVTVWSLNEIDGLKECDLVELTGNSSEYWSAFTIRVEDNHFIVFNPDASSSRINSVVMHELSHIILGHQLVSAGMTADGHLIPSSYDQSQEHEADWLAGTLLLPRPALVSIRKRALTDADARATYLVSQDMFQWRVRMTGVDYQMANARRRYGT